MPLADRAACQKQPVRMSGPRKLTRRRERSWRASRPVGLVFRDDAGEAACGEAICTRMIEDDGVDLVVGGDGPASLLAAMPENIRRQRYFAGRLRLGANNGPDYPNCRPMPSLRFWAQLPEAVPMCCSSAPACGIRSG